VPGLRLRKVATFTLAIINGSLSTVKVASFEAIVRALQDAAVRYLVAGGLAVNAHGYLRFTKDVDLVVQLEPENVRRALNALAALGYRPAIPVKAEQFADPVQRALWAREKGMQVFQLWSDRHQETPIDVFVDEPFGFDQEYAQAVVKPLRADLPVRFVTIPTLIRMKEIADRPQDRIDIEHLRLRLLK
jgi:hypothetical protein